MARLSLYDSSWTATGTRSYPEVAALRLLVELRAIVAQLAGETARRQSTGSDTMRVAVLTLSKVAQHAGFETSRTARIRTVYGQIQNTLAELSGAARMAGFGTYGAICERVSRHLRAPIRAGEIPDVLLDVLHDWTNHSLQYVGATPTPDRFPEASALVAQLLDPRWADLYEPPLPKSLSEGLVLERLPRAPG